MNRYQCEVCINSWEGDQPACPECGCTFRLLAADEPDTFAIRWQRLKRRWLAVAFDPHTKAVIQNPTEEQRQVLDEIYTEAAKQVRAEEVAVLKKALAEAEVKKVSLEDGFWHLLTTGVQGAFPFPVVKVYFN